MLVQLSDPHLGATWGGRDPEAALAAAVDAVRRTVPRPDAVLLSGDLADHGAGDEYEQVKALVAPLGVPVHVLPGNHDDRAALRRCFELPGEGAAPVAYAAEAGELRLVALDTTCPGEEGGELDADRLGWLDATLAAAPAAPTLLAMHHTPLVTGVPAWDAYRLADADRRALAEVILRHPQVVGITGGHFHRTITAALAGRPVLATPSTLVQAALTPGATEAVLGPDPPGFAVHALVDGRLVSHVAPVLDAPAFAV